MKEKTMTLEELKHRLDDVFSSIRSIVGTTKNKAVCKVISECITVAELLSYLRREQQ